MESGALPNRFIISFRRLLYHHNILKREETELVKRIYLEQTKNPKKGDFVELLKEDFKILDMLQNNEKIQKMNKNMYKQMIRKSIKNAALRYLTKKQESHSKILRT